MEIKWPFDIGKNQDDEQDREDAANAKPPKIKKSKLSPIKKMEYEVMEVKDFQTKKIEHNKNLGEFIVRKEQSHHILYQISFVMLKFEVYYDSDGRKVDERICKDLDQAETPEYYLTPIKVLMDEGYFCVRKMKDEDVTNYIRDAKRDIRAVKVTDKLIANRLK